MGNPFLLRPALTILITEKAPTPAITRVRTVDFWFSFDIQRSQSSA